jgi:hypothetical protein
MSLSDYLEAEILDHIFSKGAYTPPTWYVGLSTADPGEDGATLSEPTAMAYARVALGAVTRTAGSVVNNAAVEFVEATGDWGTISHVVLFRVRGKHARKWGLNFPPIHNHWKNRTISSRGDSGNANLKWPYKNLILL